MGGEGVSQLPDADAGNQNLVLSEQQLLLTTEPTLQPKINNFKLLFCGEEVKSMPDMTTHRAVSLLPLHQYPR